MRRRILIGLGIGVSATLIAWVLSLTSLAQSTEGAAYDLRLRWTAPPAPPDSPIVVVEINESSIRALEPSFGRWPWPRIAHAVAIDFLKQAGAKVIAYDVLFTERDTRGEFDLGGQRVSGSSSDAALVESVAAAGNVVLLSNAVYEGLAGREGTEPDGRASTACGSPSLPGTTFAPGPGFIARRCLDLPFVGLAEATAGVGHNFSVVASIAQRELDPFIETQGVSVPALGMAAALLALGVGPADVQAGPDGPLAIGDRRLPLRQAFVPGGASAEVRGTARKAVLWFRRPMAKIGRAHV